MNGSKQEGGEEQARGEEQPRGEKEDRVSETLIAALKFET